MCVRRLLLVILGLEHFPKAPLQLLLRQSCTHANHADVDWVHGHAGKRPSGTLLGRPGDRVIGVRQQESGKEPRRVNRAAVRRTASGPNKPDAPGKTDAGHFRHVDSQTRGS